MELLGIIIIVALILRFIVKKHPEWKKYTKKTVGFSFVMIVCAFMLMQFSKEFLEEELPSIDRLRYVSTYTPFFGEDVETLVQYAQDYGYMSDEIVSRSAGLEDAFGFAIIANTVSSLGLVLSVVLALMVYKMFFKFENKEKSIKILAFATLSALAVGFTLLILSAESTFGGSEDYLVFFSVILCIVIIIVLYYEFLKNYKKDLEDLKQIHLTKQDEN